MLNNSPPTRIPTSCLKMLQDGSLELSAGFCIPARAASCLTEGPLPSWGQSIAVVTGFYSTGSTVEKFLCFLGTIPPSAPLFSAIAFVLCPSSVTFFSFGLLSFAGATWQLYWRTRGTARAFTSLPHLPLCIWATLQLSAPAIVLLSPPSPEPVLQPPCLLSPFLL